MSENLKIQPLSSSPEERAEEVSSLTRSGKLVSVLTDSNGNFYATVKDSLTEIHPKTGLPVLHD